jgi:two-component system nitrate/nitrite response regulator NarL
MARRTPPPPRAVRVVVADEQPLFRDALARAIRQQPPLDLALQVADGDAALAALERLRPDVLVVSDTLLDAERRLLAPSHHTRSLLLAADPAPDDAYAAIEEGAAGYLSRESPPQALTEAISAVARGETVLDPQVQTGLAREIRLRAHDERPVLSPRELEILRLIAAGRSAPQIARELHLSTATVKTHILHLYEKLGVAERAAAVAEAMRRGLPE